MYRFNELETDGIYQRLLFKYNKCIGSIVLHIVLTEGRLEFKYNKCIGSINQGMIESVNEAKFKYNKCIGSINYFYK